MIKFRFGIIHYVHWIKQTLRNHLYPFPLNIIDDEKWNSSRTRELVLVVEKIISQRSKELSKKQNRALFSKIPFRRKTRIISSFFKISSKQNSTLICQKKKKSLQVRGCSRFPRITKSDVTRACPLCQLAEEKEFGTVKFRRKWSFVANISRPYIHPHFRPFSAFITAEYSFRQTFPFPRVCV